MQNISVSGVVLSIDKYNRARLLIETSSEIYKLIEHIKQPDYVKFPFEGKEINYSEIVLIITLKNHKKFWMDKLNQYRGKKITVELSPRQWSMGGNVGISLDLVNIT